MKNCITGKQIATGRSGLTLVEVVVAFFCLGLLMTVIFPSILKGRRDGRRTQCLNNLRNVTVAVHNFASSSKSRLLAQAYYPSKIASDGSSWQTYEGSSWVVQLLPFLDCNASYDSWNFDEPWNSTLETAVGGISNSSIVDRYSYERVLACPEDDSAFQLSGGLSYAVNCGIGDLNWTTTTGVREAMRVESGQHYMVEPFDWNGNGVLPPEDLEDAAVTRDFTLFWPEFSPPDGMKVDPNLLPRHGLNKIYDGTSNTIMLGENINAGCRRGQTKLSWADPQASSNALILPIDAKRVSPTAMMDDNSLAALVVCKPVNPAINAARNAGEGKAPFINSSHSGVGVVSFVDGSVSTLSEDIDMSVYVRLLTPCGTKLRDIEGFVSESPLRSDEF